MNRKSNKAAKIIIGFILISFMPLQLLPPVLANNSEICRFTISKNHPNFSFNDPDVKKKPNVKNNNEKSCCKNLSILLEPRHKKPMGKVSTEKTCCPDKCDGYSFSCCIQTPIVFLLSSNEYLCLSLLFIIIHFNIFFVRFNHARKYFRPPRMSFIPREC